MISRQWHGTVNPKYAEDYLAHLRSEIIPEISKIPGFVEASFQKRSVNRGIEFLVVTYWASMEAIREFAGPNLEQAVVPKRVQQWMVDYDRTVSHYEVL